MSHAPARTRTKGSAGQTAAIVFIAASLIALGGTAFAQDNPADVVAAGTVARSADEGPSTLLGTGPSTLLGTGPSTLLATGPSTLLGAGPLHAALRRARLEQGPALTPQTQQRSSWVGRHPVITGTLIGAAGGAALSRTRTAGGANHDPRVMLIGAGAGAWGGLVAGAVQKARAKEKISVGEKIGIAAGAIGIVVLPLLACYGAGGCGGVS